MFLDPKNSCLVWYYLDFDVPILTKVNTNSLNPMLSYTILLGENLFKLLNLVVQFYSTIQQKSKSFAVIAFVFQLLFVENVWDWGILLVYWKSSDIYQGLSKVEINFRKDGMVFMKVFDQFCWQGILSWFV